MTAFSSSEASGTIVGAALLSEKFCRCAGGDRRPTIVACPLVC